MAEVLRVEGGRPLEGEIYVRGAKNLVSKAMVAALLGETPSTLRNVPLIRDVDVVADLLRLHGVEVEYDDAAGVLNFDTSNVESAHVRDVHAYVGASRIPILLCGPLLHRLGEARSASGDQVVVEGLQVGIDEDPHLRRPRVGNSASIEQRHQEPLMGGLAVRDVGEDVCTPS